MPQRYMAFAREAYDQPLTLRGEIEASDVADVNELARRKFGLNWVELSIVPESATHWILRSDEKTSGEELAR